MLKAVGKKWIDNIRMKLIALYFLKTFIYSVIFGLLLIPIVKYFGLNSFLMTALGATIAFVSILIIKKTWKITSLDVANYLNSKFSVLEESATLFLKSESELSLLEKFQVDKISKVVPIPRSLKAQFRSLWLSLLLLIVMIELTVSIPIGTLSNHQLSTFSDPKITKEKVLPEINEFNIQISPPKYTGRAMRLQKQFALKLEAGAQVTWAIKTNGLEKKMRLIFNDKEIVDIQNSGQLSKKINQSGFYQIELDGKKSDLYPIEIIPDLPVAIKIIQPKPHTTIDIGQIPKVNLSVLLTDDYGIVEANISATLSSGKGEGVSFTEKKLNFSSDFRNKKTVKLNKSIDLLALGMKPGDELYFFINAIDNNGQASRSDVYLITIVDPAELLSMAGMTNGVDLVPEYFRSQRQIIIDTEKLIKEQSILTTDEFKNRSNVLGMDQKLLRLRYGKFLGEESETGPGGEHDHDEEGHEEVAFGDVTALMDEYAHKHDIAEDATFFEPELKTQLKAVLNEMWSSELRLRTYKPKEALPFEYKALRLLKDLQQKSRAYVAKTTIKTVKLKMEKRLTGELDKITQPKIELKFEQNNHSVEALKLVLAVLEKHKADKSFSYGDRELLRQGERQIISAARSQPTSYLPALKSLRKISTSNHILIKDIDVVQKAIQQLVGVETLKPQTKVANPEVNLYRNYFKRLQNGI